MMWRAVLVFLIMASSLVSAAKEHVAQRFEVTGTVRADGSLEVVEVIAFRFTGGTFTHVNRELRTTETDGVEVIEASMDGRALPRGDQEGQVEIDAGRRRTRITWRFAPAADRVHVFSLRYRYAGVVRYGEGEDWFRWPPFPSRFEYPVETGTARLFWPAGARPRSQSAVDGPVASVSPLDNGIELSVANYRQRDDDVMLTARFEPGAFTGQEPEWQRDARRAAGMAPAFVAGAAMIAAATVLAMWLFFLRYRRDGVDPPVAAGSVAAPPDDLPPALAGALTSGRVSVSWPQLLGAVFDLVRRDVLRIEGAKDEGPRLLRKPRFRLMRGPGDVELPHERVVVDALFKGGASEERFHVALRRLGGRSGRVGREIRSELAAARLIDPDRRGGARALTVAGMVVMAVAMMGAVLVALAGMRLGVLAMSVPLALFLSGLGMVIIGAAFSTLSRQGVRVSRRWDAYRRHLKAEIKRGRVPADGEVIGRMLPHAAALGLLPAFGNALAKTDVRNLPPWLRTLDAAGGSGGLVAVIAASARLQSVRL
ncbi:MAG TPA: DUF2207 domain-containing protein [Vicinamibacterales bacterium]|nr:DUF2207 domain-containing protein [Vicinamibacterales bacterium]